MKSFKSEKNPMQMKATVYFRVVLFVCLFVCLFFFLLFFLLLLSMLLFVFMGGRESSQFTQWIFVLW